MTCPAYELPKQTLLSTISSLFERRSLFFSNPDSDFTRVKKISFEQSILFPIIAGKENTATELIDFFDEGKIPLPSAMISRPLLSPLWAPIWAASPSTTSSSA